MHFEDVHHTRMIETYWNVNAHMVPMVHTIGSKYAHHAFLVGPTKEMQR